MNHHLGDWVLHHGRIMQIKEIHYDYEGPEGARQVRKSLVLLEPMPTSRPSIRIDAVELDQQQIIR